MKKTSRYFRSIFLVFGVLPVWLQSQDLQSEFDAICADHKLVGATLVTLCNGEASYYYYGSSNLAAGSPTSAETGYRIASISKLITAMGAMKMAEDNVLDLDADISDYLGFSVSHPNFPDHEITARRLLSHTSTLVDGDAYFNFLGDTYNQFPPPMLEELLTPGGDYYASNLWNSGNSPGNYFTYSNLNFGVLATVMEAASEQRFDQYMREHFFDLMDIEGDFNIYELGHIDQLAVLYRNGIAQADDYGGVNPPAPNWDLYQPGRNALLFAPQGGLRITGPDLLKLLSVLQSRGTYNNGTFDLQLLSEASVEEMLSPAWTYDGSNGNNYYGLFNQWGLGVHSVTGQSNQDVVLEDIPMKGHPGEAYGLLSDLYFSQTHDYGLIFITNGYLSGGAYEFGSQSAFYTVEEAVFDLLESDLAACQAVPVLTTTLKKTSGVQRITNLLGQEVSAGLEVGQLYFFWMSDGTVEKRMILVE